MTQLLSPMMRGFITLCGLILLWQIFIMAFDLPKYIVPSPLSVLDAFIYRLDYFMHHLSYTAIAIIVSIMVGVFGGAINGLLLLYLPPLRRWILPLLLATQAIPIFAIAPLLVMWFGYGLLPKVLVASMIIFFPVTITFYDGTTPYRSNIYSASEHHGGNTMDIIPSCTFPCMPTASR